MGVEEEEENISMAWAESDEGYIQAIIRQWQAMVFKSVLNVKPSRSLLPSLIDATYSVLKGTYTGIQILLTYPFVSTNNLTEQRSKINLLPDAIIGIVSGVMVAGSGVVAGVYNVYSGLGATLGDLWNGKGGMIWDEEGGKWGYFSLDGEVTYLTSLMEEYNQKLEDDETINNNNNDSTNEDGRRRRDPNLRSRSKKRVKDLSYYNTLKVPTDASSSEIKRAYYSMAMDVHPDKNPNDAFAEKKFQTLSTAYQTLSDDKTRDAYDNYGASCGVDPNMMNDSFMTNAVDQIDPYVFFATMFGSYLVEPYIGVLAIASSVDHLFEFIKIMIEEPDYFKPPTTKAKRKSVGPKSKEKKQYAIWMQQKRQATIALNLRTRIEEYAASTPDSLVAFRQSCRKEAARIARGDFGELFLTAIGNALVASANVRLGYQTSLFGMRGGISRMSKYGSSFVNNLATKWQVGKIIRFSISTYLGSLKKDTKTSNASSSMDGDEQCDEKDDPNEKMERMMDKMEEGLEYVLLLSWKMNVQDISNTIDAACAKLLAEEVSPEERRRRAEGLQIMGGEFLEVGGAKADTNRRKDESSSSESKSSSQERNGVKNNNDFESILQRIEVAVMNSVVLNDDDTEVDTSKKKRRKTRAAA